MKHITSERKIRTSQKVEKELVSCARFGVWCWLAAIVLEKNLLLHEKLDHQFSNWRLLTIWYFFYFVSTSSRSWFTIQTVLFCLFDVTGRFYFSSLARCVSCSKGSSLYFISFLLFFHSSADLLINLISWSKMWKRKRTTSVNSR